MNYMQRINQLLELCQDGWVSLQQCEKQQRIQNPSTNSPKLHQAIEDLHVAIKRLVQLQDRLDGNEAIVDDPVWAENTDAVMEQVRTQLQHALSTANPLSGHLDNNHYHNRIIGTTTTHSTPILITTRSSTSSTSTLSSPPLIPDKPGSAASSVSSSIINASIPEEEQHSDERSFGRRSISVEDWPPVQPESATRRLRMLPLFKNLQSTRSTPLPGGSPANINFFNEVEKRPKELFACDAIVNQPLRIGHGYGSYICYSCTVMSDKGPPISVRKRYSEFVDLREELVKRYPRLKSSIPKLPPKKVVGKFTPAFVEQRRRDLEYFFKYIVLHPTLGASPIVMDWIAP